MASLSKSQRESALRQFQLERNARLQPEVLLHQELELRQ
jgi:hypothetical protein